MDLLYSTINATIEAYQIYTTETRSFCCGQPKILSNADKRYILFLIKCNPFMKIEVIYKSLDKPVSIHTVGWG